MWEINENFEDFKRPNRPGLVGLNPDKEINHYQVSYPITWTGFISGHKIEIIQKRESALFLSDFEFKSFPPEYESMKGQIIDWINHSLKCLD